MVKYERQVVGLKQKIYVVGIGPGAPKMMTPEARQALEECDCRIPSIFKASW